MKIKTKRFFAAFLAVLITLVAFPFVQAHTAPGEALTASALFGLPYLKQKAVTISIGQKFYQKLYDSNGKKISSDKIKWSSSDKSVVNVSSKGTITGVKTGTVRISAKYDGKTFSCIVLCVKPALKYSSKTIAVGESFTQKLLDASGKEIAADSIKWKSADTKTATVSSGGKVKGVKAGTVKITATFKKTAYDFTVTVIKPTISPVSKTIMAGETFTLKLSVGSKAAEGKITWSSSDKKVATVTSKGVVKGVKAGTAKIYAEYFGKKYSSNVTVTKAPKAPTSVNEIIKAYNSAVNLTKAQKNFSVSEKYELDIVVTKTSNESIKSVMQSVLGELSKPTTTDYIFVSGKTSDGETPDMIIPPYEKACAMKSKYVSSAKASIENKETVIKFTLIPEKAVFDGEKETQKAEGNKLLNGRDDAGFEIDAPLVSTYTIDYTGTEVTARINSKGLLTKLVINTPEKMKIKGSVSETTIELETENELIDTFTFKY